MPRLDIDTRLDGDRGDLLNNVGRGVQVDDALVDAHLEAVPGVRACGAPVRLRAGRLLSVAARRGSAARCARTARTPTP